MKFLRYKTFGAKIKKLAAALVLSLSTFPVVAQTVSFTIDQVEAGKKIYDLNCASCHGMDLEGAAVIPGLADSTFAAKWSGAELNNLATDLRRMPPGNQSQLGDPDYQALAAYILAFNGAEAANIVALDLDSGLLLPQLTESNSELS